MVTVVRLDSEIQHYAWGSTAWMAQCLGRSPSGDPEAELWMGAHPKAPSRVVGTLSRATNLLQLIEADPQRLLGSDVHQKFGRLPFLFKVLAAEQPLSLQAHPSKAQAALGFAREEEQGVALSSERRNYKDRSDKPELIYALQPFFALCGFREFQKTVNLLMFLSARGARTEVDALFGPFLRRPDHDGMKALFDHVFSLPRAALEGGTTRLLAAFATGADDGDGLSPWLVRFLPWLDRLAMQYPGDPGVALALCLNFVELAPGEAMFLPAGVLHSYLSGLGLEIMASSDNVLRGGLTAKHVDAAELTSVLGFEGGAPHVSRGDVWQGKGVSKTTFAVPIPEFELELIELTQAQIDLAGPAILLVLQGHLRLASEELAQGDQYFVSAEHGEMLRGTGRIALAKVGRWQGRAGPRSAL